MITKLVPLGKVLRVVREWWNGDSSAARELLDRLRTLSPSTAEAPSGAIERFINAVDEQSDWAATFEDDIEAARLELAELRKSHEDSIKEALEFNAGWDCATEEAAAEIGEFASMGYAWRHFDELQAKAAERDSAVTEERERCLAICRYYRRRWGHGEMGSACPVIAEAIASGKPALSATADSTNPWLAPPHPGPCGPLTLGAIDAFPSGYIAPSGYVVGIDLAQPGGDRSVEADSAEEEKHEA